MSLTIRCRIYSSDGRIGRHCAMHSRVLRTVGRSPTVYIIGSLLKCQGPWETPTPVQVYITLYKRPVHIRTDVNGALHIWSIDTRVTTNSSLTTGDNKQRERCDNCRVAMAIMLINTSFPFKPGCDSHFEGEMTVDYCHVPCRMRRVSDFINIATWSW